MHPHDPMDPKVSEAHSETLDFLSRPWCNFAIQALQSESHNQSPDFLPNTPIKKFEGDTLSWIWMHQATHPEVNYRTGFQKKWWKRPSAMSIKKWAKEMKEKRKEDKRLQKAEVHAAVSIAGLAAALTAIAEENSKRELKLKLEHEQSPAMKAALASAAAIVASHCAQVARSLGATRCQLANVISSALSGTSTSHILILSAAASTSLRGATTLKARARCRNRGLNGASALPIEMDNSKLDEDLDFERCTSVLAKGATLTVGTANGKSMARLVSLHLNNEAKVILRIMKRHLLNIITSKKDCLVLDLHAELYKDSGGDEYDRCYQIVLMTTSGTITLDMADDYQRYKMWAKTINQMLKLQPSLTKNELRFRKY
uniref:PH domain-containing protein n=3 Tax=Opuntia streptacantha TaxID=393608 RepID=A0A7C9DLI1_OPUST